MSSWGEMAANNRTAAFALFATGQWRSFASRAYYAVYADATRCLLQASVRLPAGRSNPGHRTLPKLIENNLYAVRPQARSRLAGLVQLLYDFRLIADYSPTVKLNEDEARVALGLMRQALDILRVVP